MKTNRAWTKLSRELADSRMENDRLRHAVEVLEQFRDRAYAAEASVVKWERRFDDMLKLVTERAH